MKQLSGKLAVILLATWVLALLLNIDIYKKANIEINIFGPIIDAIMIMAIALGVFVVVANRSSGDRQLSLINKGLLLLGVGTLFMISFFYVTTFW